MQKGIQKDYDPAYGMFLVTDNIRSVKRSPLSDLEPKQIFLHWTAGRRLLSAILLVGSTPSCWMKVNK